MRKTVIYLVRHGQTEGNVKKQIQGKLPNPLNETGRTQAKRLGEVFRAVPLDSIHASPVHRTMETAKEIFAHPIECPEFGERDFGMLEGLTGDELKKRIPDVEKQWAKEKIDWQPPGGGETIREFQARCIKAFEDMVKRSEGKTVLVVTHGGVLQSIVHWLHGGKPEEFFHINGPENAEAFKVVYDGKTYTVEHKKVADATWKKYLYQKLEKPRF